MINIPFTSQKRLVIIGGGFGGLNLARNLADSNIQLVLIDKNNYHQFQPLFYQVATAGLEPSSIAFPFRKVFQSQKNIHIRMAEVVKINAGKNEIETNIGNVSYDYLVIAIGTDTNFFGMANMKKFALPMKSVSDALFIRNTILQNFENALATTDANEREGLLNIVIVGGGPTGVEVAGSLAEMKTHILPKDYPDLDFKQMQIHLLEASAKVLNVMSEEASVKSKLFLEKLGVQVSVDTKVNDYDGTYVYLGNGEKIRTTTLIWAAGVAGNKIEGLNPEVIGKSNRIKVDRYCKVLGYENVFAIGDIALMTEDKFPNGHPQLAQPAMQQANLLAQNFKRTSRSLIIQPFSYKDLGSMATIGRNLAVADLPFIRLHGFIAWLIWMFVHLMGILGVKNKVFIFINWCWSYFTYDQSLRLIIKPKTDGPSPSLPKGKGVDSAKR